MAFDPITPIPELPTKPDAESATWNTRYLEIDALFDLLENAVGAEFWNGQTFAVPSGTGDENGHIINNEGTPLTQRVNLDFIGASVAAADSGGNTEVTINGAVLAKNIESLTGNKTLTDASEPIQVLTPDVARDVNLPAEAVTNPFFLIANPTGSGFTLTIKDDSPAIITTILDGETKLIVPDGVTWYVLAGGGASPLTTKGDVYGYSTVDARIPVGSNGQVLTADSAQALGLKWDDPLTSPLTTKGDIVGYDTDDNRIPIGTNGQVLTADSAQALGLKWEDTQTSFGKQTLTPGATVDWDLDLGPFAQLTLGQDTTINAPTNIEIGATYVMKVINGASWTITFNAIFKFQGGIAPIQTVGASNYDIYTFVSFDGTNLESIQSQDFS